MKVGIFFGGQSREREISFAGGRTVYDNLDKNLFEPIPIFVDSLGNFIILNWLNIYKGTIRDFYPAAKFYAESDKDFQLYIENIPNLTDSDLDTIISDVGKRTFPHELAATIDFAFLALHGSFGEDGNIQGLLEWYGIPYSGSGILPCAIGIDKLIQKKIMTNSGYQIPEYEIINRTDWKNCDQIEKQNLLDYLLEGLGSKFVIKSPHQGSSIGISVIVANELTTFDAAINKSFFIQKIEKSFWTSIASKEKNEFIAEIVDIKVGIGLPVLVKIATYNTIIYNPTVLLQYIDNHFKNSDEDIVLESENGEEFILAEQFIEGIEFSCIVIQNEDGNPVALPPTQILKSNELFDYRSKYLPGIARKITPIDLPTPHIEIIRERCTQLFQDLYCNVYARIDGFFGNDGQIYLNDPNTTSGMLPSSFFFHQAAEIGMNPSQFLTYIIRTSLAERIKSGKRIYILEKLLHKLDATILENSNAIAQKIKVAVIMGGYSSERHISVESGRNIYEKLASSAKYLPTPIFLTGDNQHYQLYELPINIMLKDNADDIKKMVTYPESEHAIIEQIKIETSSLSSKYIGNNPSKLAEIPFDSLPTQFDAVFIALHGRPGEDGNIQAKLDAIRLPYNGSGAATSALTINKYATNEKLREAGFLVANHKLVHILEWQFENSQLLSAIESEFPYPFIAKPNDDGCSSAVKKITDRNEFVAFGNMMFRESAEFLKNEASILNLKYHEEFPQKQYFLIEELITKQNANHFLEITGGMLTTLDENKNINYEIFEPSETLASGDILSLEEKFLAGQGQNLTPARFSIDAAAQKIISNQVKDVLKNVAKTLTIEGYCRIDAFVRIFDSNYVEVLIIEINSLPGMTPATCIFHQCGLNKYTPYQFVDKILEYGMGKLN